MQAKCRQNLQVVFASQIRAKSLAKSTRKTLKQTSKICGQNLRANSLAKSVGEIPRQSPQEKSLGKIWRQNLHADSEANPPGRFAGQIRTQNPKAHSAGKVLRQNPEAGLQNPLAESACKTCRQNLLADDAYGFLLPDSTFRFCLRILPPFGFYLLFFSEFCIRSAGIRRENLHAKYVA